MQIASYVKECKNKLIYAPVAFLASKDGWRVDRAYNDNMVKQKLVVVVVNSNKYTIISPTCIFPSENLLEGLSKSSTSFFIEYKDNRG